MATLSPPPMDRFEKSTMGSAVHADGEEFHATWREVVSPELGRQWFVDLFRNGTKVETVPARSAAHAQGLWHAWIYDRQHPDGEVCR